MSESKYGNGGVVIVPTAVLCRNLQKLPGVFLAAGILPVELPRRDVFSVVGLPQHDMQVPSYDSREKALSSHPRNFCPSYVVQRHGCPFVFSSAGMRLRIEGAV